MIFEIADKLKENSYIREHVEERIRAYQYPKPEDLHAPHIIIDPLDVPTPADFGDNTWTTDDFLYQIEAWSHDYEVTKKLSHEIRLVLWSLGFGQQEGTDEYNEEFNIFRDARRYRGKKYTDEFNK